MSSGKKQHYMSATAISQFSYEAKADKPNREKRVHLKLVESDVVLDQKASDVLKKKNLYTLNNTNEYLEWNTVDNLWDYVQEQFPLRLAELKRLKKRKELPIELFLYFVEYASELVGRNPMFDHIFGQRTETIFGANLFESPKNRKDNTNLARMMEIQRLRTLLLYSKFEILLFAPSSAFINNDLGYAVAIRNPKHEVGLPLPTLVFPLDPSIPIGFVVGTKAENYQISKFYQSVPVSSIKLNVKDVEFQNNRIKLSSQSLIFSNRASLLSASFGEDAPKAEFPLYALDFLYWFNDSLIHLSQVHEQDYDRLTFLYNQFDSSKKLDDEKVD